MADAADRLAAALADRYSIERELGVGGMATVYLAEDLKHQRKVAIKVLKPELAAVLGAERFVQEITTTAQLQHPHILPLFDSGTADGFLFYVMPYVEGETLRDKLNRETQLGVEESVRITREVADALDYAHRHGVIHRDIKPENILLHDGRPMVADFGIALAVSAAAGGRMTETGMSLGTPHYMSPEQATADKEITGRSDVYSLASVLYEMLTGDPPHVGSSAQQIIVKIIADEARPVGEVRKSVPANVAATLAKALEKLPADRFESAKAFADALADPGFRTTAPGVAGPAELGMSSRVRRGTLWLVSAVAVVATATAVVLAVRRPTSPQGPLVISSLQPPPGEDFSERASFGALSPDGRAFAFVAIAPNGERDLWVRRLDTLSAQMVRGTEGAGAPFWSPDGRSVAYFAHDALMRVDVPGGTPRNLCPTTPEESGTWGGNGVIVFATGRGLERVDAAGGPCAVAIPLDSTATVYRHPSFLPGGGRILFERTEGFASEVMVGDLQSGATTPLIPGAAAPTWVPPEYVVYGRFNEEGNSALYAQRIRAIGSAVEGDATPLTGPVRTSKLVFAYAASERGSLLYLPGLGDREKLIADRAGEVVDTVRVDNTFTHRYAHAHPWVALGNGKMLWLYNLDQGLSTPLVPQGPATDPGRAFPVWAPSDSAVAFGWCHLSVVRVADLSVRRIAPQSTECRRATDWSSDGRYLVITNIPSPDARTSQDAAGTPQGHTSVAALDLAQGRTIRFKVPGNASEGALSPDMRWIAYTSDEAGTPEVYVQPFPGGGRSVRVSRQGGRAPRWTSDGRQLVFEAPDGGILVASVTPGPDFQPASPRLLFHAPGWTRSLFFDSGTPYDVSPDGQRFIVRQTASAKDAVLIQNWPAKLEAKGGS
jgi:serine/threonine protein kinase